MNTLNKHVFLKYYYLIYVTGVIYKAHMKITGCWVELSTEAAVKLDDATWA